MKVLGFVFIFSFKLFASDEYKNSACYKRYQGATKAKQANHRAKLYYQVKAASYGMVLNNPSIVDDQNYWERDLLLASDSKGNGLFKEILEKVQNKYPEVDGDKVIELFRDSFQDGSLCDGFLGSKKRKRGVIQEIKVKLKKELAGVNDSEEQKIVEEEDGDDSSSEVEVQND
jgi:hypothetical protein